MIQWKRRWARGRKWREKKVGGDLRDRPLRLQSAASSVQASGSEPCARGSRALLTRTVLVWKAFVCGVRTRHRDSGAVRQFPAARRSSAGLGDSALLPECSLHKTPAASLRNAVTKRPPASARGAPPTDGKVAAVHSTRDDAWSLTPVQQRGGTRRQTPWARRGRRRGGGGRRRAARGWGWV